METENDNDVLINTLLSFKHVLASYHDTIENYIIALEEIDTLQQSHHACNCHDSNGKPHDSSVKVNIHGVGVNKSHEKLSDKYPELVKRYTNI